MVPNDSEPENPWLSDEHSAPQTRREAKKTWEKQPKHHRQVQATVSVQHSAGRQPGRKHHRLRLFVVLGIIFGLLVGSGVTAAIFFQPELKKVVSLVLPSADYTGNGSGTVFFTIREGDTGLSISRNLNDAGVTASADGFYTLLLNQKPAVVFEPGVFRLAKRMSNKAALTALVAPRNRVEYRVTIPEGSTEAQIFALVSSRTGIPLSDFQNAAANPIAFGLPSQAKSLEGFLFPATYNFNPGVSATAIIQTMVARMNQALASAGVSTADRWNTVVLASIVQSEARISSDFPKVARVFVNRLAAGWPLQSDATVNYGSGSTGKVTTTDAARADASNPYNTYVHPGLPIGPISNPGQVAINAAVNPVAGPWMYFVTWNLATGETIFSTTHAEQDAAVQKWQQWMKENPGYD